MADCGDVTILPADVEKNFDKIANSVRRILQKGAFPVIVGGDHSITFPAVKAFDRYNPLDVVHFDAHMDFTHELQGTFYSHGCPIRRCYELPFVRNIASIGIRTAAKKVYDEAVERGVKVITTDQVRQQGPRHVIEGLQPSGDIYVTFDVDGYGSGPGTRHRHTCCRGAHLPRDAGGSDGPSRTRPHRGP
jgi:agmatinase